MSQRHPIRKFFQEMWEATWLADLIEGLAAIGAILWSWVNRRKR